MRGVEEAHSQKRFEKFPKSQSSLESSVCSVKEYELLKMVEVVSLRNFNRRMTQFVFHFR